MKRDRFFYFFDEAEGQYRLWFTGWGKPQKRLKLPSENRQLSSGGAS